MFNEPRPADNLRYHDGKIDTGIRFVREIRQKDKDVPIYLLSDIGRLTAATSI